MSSLNINELYGPIHEKNIKRLEHFDSILQKIHTRIKSNAGKEQTHCFYQIPEFVIGTPLYDVSELRNYIMNSLKTNGFDILYVEPNWLFIYWNVKGSKSLVKNTNISKQVNNQYKSTDTYKPSGDFIYDDSSLMNMADKFKI